MKSCGLFILFCFSLTPCFSIPRDSIQSLINIERVSDFVLEKGISASVVSVRQGKRLLKIESDINLTKAPSAYFATVDVIPGQTYTYLVKGYKTSAPRVLLFIGTPSGDAVVWPGADVGQGSARTTFQVPEKVEQITLALSFLYPAEKSYVLIEEIALFRGNVEPPADHLAMNPESPVSKPKRWVLWFYFTALILLPLVLYYVDKRPPHLDNILKKSAEGIKRAPGLHVISMIGAGLAVYQFVSNRSLWLDEASLALSIVRRNYVGLLSPLDYGQVAPILFLWVEKLFTEIFTDVDRGLRFLPLICYVGSILLMRHVTSFITNNKLIQHASLALFCFSSALLYYSSEVKQYSIDVFTLLLMYFLLLKKNDNRLSYLWMTVAGCICIWFSNISVLILLTSGIFFVINYRNVGTFSRIFFLGLSWFVSFSIYYLFFIYRHPSRSLMLEYWHSVNAFMPLNPFQGGFWKFILKSAEEIFGAFLYRYWYAGLFLYILGLIGLIYKKNLKLIYLLVFPVVAHLALSALELYPFDLRLILYQLPLYIIGVTLGLSFFCELAKIKHAWALMYAPVLVSACFLFSSFPLQREEIKNSINYLNDYIEPSDLVYINSGAERAFRYYHEIGYTKFSNEVYYEKSYENDFDNPALAGKVWIVFSHKWTGHENMEEKTVASLMKRGRLIRSYEGTGSSIYLFDIPPPVSSITIDDTLTVNHGHHTTMS